MEWQSGMSVFLGSLFYKFETQFTVLSCHLEKKEYKNIYQTYSLVYIIVTGSLIFLKFLSSKTSPISFSPYW